MSEKAVQQGGGFESSTTLYDSSQSQGRLAFDAKDFALISPGYNDRDELGNFTGNCRTIVEPVDVITFVFAWGESPLSPVAGRLQQR